MELHRLVDGAKKNLLGWLLPGQRPEALDFLDQAADALRRPDIIEGTVCRCGEAYLTLLRWDVTNDQESWSWHAVIGVQGELPSDEGAWDELSILASIGEGFGIHFRSEGGSGAGRPFANRPWIQYLGAPTRTLIVTQSGGRMKCECCDGLGFVLVELDGIKDKLEIQTCDECQAISSDSKAQERAFLLADRSADLLDELKSVLEWIKTGKVDGVGFDEGSVADAIRSAIAKAEGRA